jgi:hypothetical protein
MDPIEAAKLDVRGGTVERRTVSAGEDTLEVRIDGRTVKVISRPADGDAGRLFELGPSPTWDDSSPLTDEDVATLVRGLISRAAKKGLSAEIIGVSPRAAATFPEDARISVIPVEPLSFSLAGAPAGLILQMDERGDGRLYALGDQRVELGGDGMWWIVTQLIDALVSPEVVSKWPRFLTLGGTLGGRATQASMEVRGMDLRIVWRVLESGVVGEVVAVHDLSHERAAGWLSLLRPVRDDLERQRAHRQRMRPAKTAERWANALERWSN